MKKLIDTSNWKRKEHFNFFKGFEDPFWSLSSQVDCTKAYRYCKDQKLSFFLFYLHKSLLAVNAVEEFRQRIEEDMVYEYELVHASPTISRADGTFGFAYFNFHLDFEQFAREASIEIEKVKNTKSLLPATNNENLIHYSTVPWVSFSGIEHPKNNVRYDSIPKIVFGKMLERDKKLFLPVFVRVNHALVDALHIGEFFNKFQSLLDLNH